MLWKLIPNPNRIRGYDPFEGYDRCTAMVVRARTEKGARFIAGKNAWGEGRDAWENPKYSLCMKIPATGVDEVIMKEEVTG